MTPSAGPAGDPPRTRRDLRRSWVPWLPMFAVLLLALTLGALGNRAPATPEERTAAIARTVKCPVCQGESVAESNAELSVAIRADIATRVAQGQSDDEIRSYYAATYGDAILLTPSSSGLTGLVWVIPVVALALAVFGLVVVFRRWGSEAPAHATDDDVELVRRALDDAHRRAAVGGSDDDEGSDDGEDVTP